MLCHEKVLKFMTIPYSFTHVNIDQYVTEDLSQVNLRKLIYEKVESPIPTQFCQNYIRVLETSKVRKTKVVTSNKSKSQEINGNLKL